MTDEARLNAPRRCEDDRCWPAWYGDNPWPKCSTCQEPVFHDGEVWRHVTRG